MKRIICLLLPIMLLCGCSGKSEVPELLEPAKVDADIETATRGEIFNVVMYEASIEPQVIGQSFVSGGSIDELNITLGDVVAAGDVLATLDTTAARQQRDALAAEIEYKTTNHEFDMRRMELEAQLAESTDSTGTLEAQLIRLQAEQQQQLFSVELEELEKQLEALERSIENDELTASCDGTVVKMNVQPGGNVRGGSACVYIADDDTKVITSEYISQSDIDKCDRVYASIGGAEYDVEYLPYERDVFLQLSVSNAEMTSTFSIINPTEDIENGMFTCVYLVTDYVEDALKVPANAVHKDPGGSYVYLEQNGEQVKQYVEVGVVTGAEVQIISGLEEGDAFYVAS
ncbi:MAG: biotin/lipoyl-binding protein [Ruminococcaceae bacterium]|nr:biotin/lipoyl-binding protein [Oscillospiraceae bacterium]